MEENPMVDGKIATLTLGESKLPCIRRHTAAQDRSGGKPDRADAFRRQADRRESQHADGGGDRQRHRRCLRRAALRPAADGGEDLLGDESEIGSHLGHIEIRFGIGMFPAKTQRRKGNKIPVSELASWRPFDRLRTCLARVNPRFRGLLLIGKICEARGAAAEKKTSLICRRQ